VNIFKWRYIIFSWCPRSHGRKPHWRHIVVFPLESDW
jgi:hypothetical protein